ncbi:unnamed protein product [Pleuronectes platessa]|uniref:Uncharacterized protein n=1 Tax=Pleuronectes platessa TaxID=8262 RepID=A0A9N7VVF9_PLEPL|nr:unnamed protein product [Pleuronectes platessa]
MKPLVNLIIFFREGASRASGRRAARKLQSNQRTAACRGSVLNGRGSIAFHSQVFNGGLELLGSFSQGKRPTSCRWRPDPGSEPMVGAVMKTQTVDGTGCWQKETRPSCRLFLSPHHEAFEELTCSLPRCAPSP